MIEDSDKENGAKVGSVLCNDSGKVVWKHPEKDGEFFKIAIQEEIERRFRNLVEVK